MKSFRIYVGRELTGAGCILVLVATVIAALVGYFVGPWGVQQATNYEHLVPGEWIIFVFAGTGLASFCIGWALMRSLKIPVFSERAVPHRDISIVGFSLAALGFIFLDGGKLGIGLSFLGAGLVFIVVGVAAALAAARKAPPREDRSAWMRLGRGYLIGGTCVLAVHAAIAFNLLDPGIGPVIDVLFGGLTIVLAIIQWRLERESPPEHKSANKEKPKA